MTFASINRLMGDPMEENHHLELDQSVRIAQYKYSGDDALERLLQEIDGANCSERDAYELAASWSTMLPKGLQAAILYFVRYQPADALIIKGLPLGRVADTETPVTHGQVRAVGSFEALCLAIGMLAGNPIGYATQQEGKLINDIVPIAQRADIPNFSGGFTHQFDFHTEDAFMINPPSYIQLGCVRNPTATPLTLSGLRGGDIDKKVEDKLRGNSFHIGVNPGQTGWEEYTVGTSAILNGPRTRPYLRFNDTETSATSEDSSDSLHAFRQVLQKNALQTNLEPGDVILVDNARLAHARQPYPAKCDGTDRWLLRLVIYRNLNVVRGLISEPMFPILKP